MSNQIKKLGFGCMRLPRTDEGFNAPFDIKQVEDMVDTFLKNGGTYFDTAFVYEGSEETMCKTLVKRHPRDKFTIATKLQLRTIQKAEQLKEQFETSCTRLGVDYVDYYMLHGIDAKVSEMAEGLGAWDFIKDLKKQGRVKTIGFSFHGSVNDLDEILTKHPEAEFVQLQINYLDWDDPKIDSRNLYETARKHNKPIIIMEPVKGGLLASETSPLAKTLLEADSTVSTASWALRYSVQLDGLLVVLSGMSNMEQMCDNIKTVLDFKPLSKDETAVMGKGIEALNAVPRVPCTDCSYCVKDCPQRIMIPRIISTFNNYTIYKAKDSAVREYGMWTGFGGKASSCIKCGKCEDICPQKIAITETLEKIAEIFE